MNFEGIIETDRQLLGVFNGNHTAFLDTLMATLTAGPTWIPLYIALLYLVVKNNETITQILVIVGSVALCLFITEFVTEGVVKPMVARPRPLVDPEWGYHWHVVGDRKASGYSFFSAHASNTFGIAVLLSLIIRNKVFTWLMVAWSLLNCYTRLYLAKHYPSDIVVGLAFGALAGFLSYLVYSLTYKQVAARQHFISSQYTKTGYSLTDIDVVVFVLVAVCFFAIIISLVMQ